MARTSIPYTTLVPNGNVAQPAGTAIDATNSHVINSARPEQTVLRVTNTHSSDHVITIKAGDYPPAWAAGLGDLTVTVVATTGVQFIGPFESGRFLKKNTDGTAALNIDIEAAHAGTITAFLVPLAT
ncbi:hypothetical protein [Frankia sp. AgB32]|uniref:hypothetical protein n=1 Tax=Frankia sp. AgB32 TaxID=631119 RepID=UPI002010A27D|nr:hypothetical protein [Frankia sp. AgB32]MCK9896963.1 hypothetical protein [Frankia sp. AgB32]